MKTPTVHRVCPLSELPVGERKIIEVGGFSVGVFNIDGEFYAIKNLCPHQLAPLCKGKISGTTLPGKVGEYLYGHEGEIIRCPWHRWEFNIKTGRSVFNPHRVRVKAYETGIEAETEEDDPGVETFAAEVQGDWVVVYV